MRDDSVLEPAAAGSPSNTLGTADPGGSCLIDCASRLGAGARGASPAAAGACWLLSVCMLQLPSILLPVPDSVPIATVPTSLPALPRPRHPWL